MVTYLCALRFAVNVEHSLQQLQQRRFAVTGDTGARALPPLIPLHRQTEAPTPAGLDGIRRTHIVTMHSSAAAPVDIPPARMTLTGTAGDQEVERQIITLQRALGADSNREMPPEIVLSWQPEPALPPPLELPETSAFWLSVFRLEPGDAPWWEYLTWRQVYCRRLRAQPH